MFLDYQDEVLCECLNSVFSGLIPHHKYNNESFAVLYPLLKTVLDPKDARGLYHVFFTIFEKYNAMATMLPTGTFKISIDRERFSKALENNIPDFILEKQTMMDDLLAQEGKSADLSIPTVQSEAMGILYEKAMALYDECFDLEISHDDAIAKIIDLKDVIKANLIETGLANQRAIMSTGVRFGRKFYSGPLGWLEFTQQLCRELSELDSNSHGDLVCNGLDVLKSVDEKVEESNEALANYGIPQLDDFTPMLKHRLGVFVARENVGKTRTLVCLTAKLIQNNVKVLFCCGETTEDSIINSVISSYIYLEYGMYIESHQLAGDGYKELLPEDRQVVDTARARIAMSGLAVCTDLEYDNVTSKISYYVNMGYRAMFIDHTQSLRGRKNRSMSELVTGLALDCRELKNQYPIYIGVASHPSSDTKDLMQKQQLQGTQVSVTAQSAALSQEADEIFILNSTEYLANQGLLEWITHKRRGAESIKPVYILKRFNVSAFKYDPKYQGVSNVDEGTLDGLMSSYVGRDDEEHDSTLDIDF